MTYAYQIIAWDENFETSTSRKLQHPHWVSVPTKQSGKGLTRILAQADGAAIFGIWVLILQACAGQKLPRAGWMTDNGTPNGPPWTIEDLAERWRREAAEITRALDVLCSPRVGWIRTCEQSPDNHPITTHHLPLSSQGGSSQGGAGGAGAQAPTPGFASDGESKKENRRLVRVRLARLRWASDDTALEEWIGLLTEEAKCEDTTECLDCLTWMKSIAKREGITSRYAAAYEGLAARWDHIQSQPAEVTP